jgi:hypothetical protein
MRGRGVFVGVTVGGREVRSRIAESVRVAGGLGGRVELLCGVGVLIVVGMLIGPLAVSAGAAFSPPIAVSGQAANAPQAVNDANGNAIVVWSQYDGAKFPVLVRQISAAGKPGPVKTLSAAAESSVYPQIAGDGDGGAIAVWSQPNGVSTPLKARSISASGRLGKLETVSRAPMTARPRIVSDGKGKAMVVWSQGRRGHHRIMARKITAAGRLGPVKTVSLAGRKAADPEIATDAHGDAIVVWSQAGEKNSLIKARRISAKGALGHVKTLSASKQNSGLPDIASDRRGDATAVWTQFVRNSGHIKARRISPKGALGQVKTLGEDNGTADISTDARGHATVAWDFYGRGQTGIQARQISPSGALGPLQTLMAQKGGVADVPSVGTDAAGNATVLWFLYRNQATWPVQARQISAAGALGPTQTITSIDGIRGPDLAVNGGGDAFAVWMQLDGSNWRVWGAFGP